MKKFKIMLLFLVPALLFTGCGKEENVDNENEIKNTETEKNNVVTNSDSFQLSGIVTDSE